MSIPRTRSSARRRAIARAAVRGWRCLRPRAAPSRRCRRAACAGAPSHPAGLELLLHRVEHLFDGARTFFDVAPVPRLEVRAALDEALRHRAPVDLLLEPRAELPRHGRPVVGERLDERRDVLPVENLEAGHLAYGRFWTNWYPKRPLMQRFPRV